MTAASASIRIVDYAPRWFAVDERDRTPGTVALRHAGDGAYEFTKMALEAYRACTGRELV